MAEPMDRARAIERLNLTAINTTLAAEEHRAKGWYSVADECEYYAAALRLAVNALEAQPAFIALAKECADDTDNRVSGGIQSMAADVLALVPGETKGA